jgi:hypothetical protein
MRLRAQIPKYQMNVEAPVEVVEVDPASMNESDNHGRRGVWGGRTNLVMAAIKPTLCAQAYRRPACGAGSACLG